MSARVRSVESFAFKYGRIEITAKMPKGDWLWPALWLLPKD
jgi:beta-glucanase (GH16 family)